jgi:hypothetical protein
MPESSFPTLDADQFEFRKRLLEEPSDSFAKGKSMWFGIWRVLGRGWFRGTWVLQEPMLARDIIFYLGSLSMTQTNLLNTFEWTRYISRNRVLIPILPSSQNASSGAGNRIPKIEPDGAIQTLKGRELFLDSSK